MIEVRFWLDEYSFYEGAAEETMLARGVVNFNFITKPELKYLDYWQWFWEGQ